mgnify:CR=1 FL=1
MISENPFNLIWIIPAQEDYRKPLFKRYNRFCRIIDMRHFLFFKEVFRYEKQTDTSAESFDGKRRHDRARNGPQPHQDHRYALRRLGNLRPDAPYSYFCKQF